MSTIFARKAASLRIFVHVFLLTAVLGSFYHQPLFSTVTPYFWTEDINRTFVEDVGMTVDYGGVSCKAFYADAVYKHGTRYPTTYWINAMNQLQNKLATNMSGSRFPFIMNWVNPFPGDKQATLTNLGLTEQRVLGERFGTRLKSLLAPNLNGLKYYATTMNRTLNSAISFNHGLNVKLGQMPETNANININDTMLRFYDNCTFYQDTVLDNPSSYDEYTQFRNGPEMTAVTDAVNKRLTDGTFNLTTDEVIVVQQMCAMELGYKNKSDWCQFFEEEDLRVIEYLNDLYNYWVKAYGHAINYEIACPLFQNMFTNFAEAAAYARRNESYSVGTLRFAHSETLAPVFAQMGLFRDTTPLMASNYASQHNRKFKSSTILPFSANIISLLYKCPAGSSPAGSETIVLRTFVNEKQVFMPSCGGVLCDFYQLLGILGPVLGTCNQDSICNKVNEPFPGMVG